MPLISKVASALSFAQRAGLARASSTEDEEEKKRDAKRAEDESDEAKAEGDDPEDEDEKKKDAKKAKAESDVEEDEDDEKRESAKAAAVAERARCEAIVAHGIKTGQLVQACAFAFSTDMTAEAAATWLDAAASQVTAQPAKAAAPTLAERMAGVKTPVVTSEREQADANSPKAIADQILAAAAKASGAKA